MTIIFPISGIAILFFVLCICGVSGRAIFSVASWLINYWWVIGIIFAIFAIIQVIICQRKWKYIFFILDIPRLCALTFLVYQFAANCMVYNDSGLSIFLFILEFVLGGILMLGILGYGTIQCASALFNTDYNENESLAKYIFGTIICLVGTFAFWALSK